MVEMEDAESQKDGFVRGEACSEGAGSCGERRRKNGSAVSSLDNPTINTPYSNRNSSHGRRWKTGLRTDEDSSKTCV